MHEANLFLQTLALVLGTAAVTTVLFQRFRQPVVLGYLLAGMVIGPHLPGPEADDRTVQTLAELGVILLMFSLGIEFSLSKLLRVGPTAGFVAVLQCSLMLWLGYLVGQAFGWTQLQSLYAGAVIAISSTTIIIKAFEEQGIKEDFTQIVFGILIVEDLIAILLITILTALSSGEELTTMEVGQAAGRLAAFLLAMLVMGLLIVPRLMRAVVRLERSETTVVASVGIAFGFAVLAHTFGYSVALGAFLAGSLVAESGVEKTVEHLVQPVRDIFAAIFFVSVGMLINPADIVENWLIVLVFLLVVILGKIFAVTLGAFLTGQSFQTSLKTGMSLAQIGEFSFIIAGVGMARGVTDNLLYSIAVAVSGITTLLTPWLIHVAQPTAAWVDKKLPRPLQTFGALYSSWLEQLRSGSADGQTNRIRRSIRWLIVDAVLVAAIIIGASIEMERIADFVEDHLNIPEKWTRLAVIAGAALLAAPFLIGLVRTARFLGFELAGRVFPAAEAKSLDLAAAPRRLLIVTLQLAIILLIGVPLVAITQPFVPPLRGAAVLLFVLLLLAFAFWRGAANFQGHTRAAAEALAESLTRQTREGRATGTDHANEEANKIFAGLGSPTPVELEAGSPAIGKTLADIRLRGLTGATVLAIRRGEQSVLIPSGQEQLQEGDVLAVAGSHHAIQAAKQLLGDHPVAT
ncbi:MAG TPA: cation:proton antiporter, partial [Lacipirellulaceae bacterium]